MTQRQELALSGGEVAVKRPQELFTPKLWKLATEVVDESLDRRARIRAIAEAPGLREEAARILPHLQAMLDGRATNAELGVALQPLLLVKRKPDFGKGEEAQRLTLAWQALYYEQIRKFPLAAVKVGVKDLVATHRFPDMPQPAELVAAIEPHAVALRTAHYRLKEAVRAAPPTPVSEVDRAANRRRMEEMGWLDRNGNVDPKRILAREPRPASPRAHPTESPQEMAARLRRSAEP